MESRVRPKVEIKSWLADLIVKAQHQVIGITGAADLGKSYLARNLASQLNQTGASAALIGLDSYLLARDKRKALGISGYHPNSHDLQSAKSDLIKLLDGEAIEYFEYQHALGKRSENRQVIHPADYIIVVGLHSLHPMLSALIDVSIFIYTSDSQLLDIRLQADLEKRLLTKEQALKQADSEMFQYHKHVAVHKDNASICLYLKHKWKYQSDI